MSEVPLYTRWALFAIALPAIQEYLAYKKQPPRRTLQ